MLGKPHGALRRQHATLLASEHRLRRHAERFLCFSLMTPALGRVARENLTPRPPQIWGAIEKASL